MLAEILETQGLEMSATYFIYAILDFKVAIRDSFLSHFSNIEAKGCSFHFQLSSRRFPIMVSSLTIQTRTASHSLHLFEQSWDCAMFLSYVQGRYLQFLPFDQTVDWEAESILCADDQLHAPNLGQWVFPSFFLGDVQPPRRRNLMEKDDAIKTLMRQLEEKDIVTI